MTLSRWKSDAYLRYIKIPKEHLAKVSSTIAHPIDTSNRLVFQSTLYNRMISRYHYYDIEATDLTIIINEQLTRRIVMVLVVKGRQYT